MIVSPVAPCAMTAPAAWGVDSLGACDATQHKALLAGGVAFVEGDAVGEVFDGVAVEIHLEFVHALRMIARGRNVAGDRVTDVDHKHGARFAAENIEIRDVEADVLPSYR